MCDSLRLFHMCLIDVNTMNEGAIFDPTISWLGRRSSFVSYHLVGSQADNLFYLNPIVHARLSPCDCPRRRRRRNVRSRLGTPCLRRDQYSLHIPATIVDIACVQLHRLVDILIANSLAITTFKQQSTSRTSSGGAHVRWNSAGAANGGGSGGGSVMSGEVASNAGLNATQVHHVTSYSFRTFHCERLRKIPLSELDPSMFLCKTEADWIDLRRGAHSEVRITYNL